LLSTLGPWSRDTPGDIGPRWADPAAAEEGAQLVPPGEAGEAAMHKIESPRPGAPLAG